LGASFGALFDLIARPLDSLLPMGSFRLASARMIGRGFDHRFHPDGLERFQD